MANHVNICDGSCLSLRKAAPPSAAAWLLIRCAALLLLLCASFARSGVQAVQYTVGDTAGWNLGVDYKTWASQFSFKTGDSLIFSYGGIHSVLQVSEADYNACNTANAISTGTGGNTEVKLDKQQSFYFICGVSSHCSNGMQLNVKVGAASSSSSPSTPSSSATPSSATNTPSSPTGDSSLAPPLPTLHTISVVTIFITICSITFSMLT